MTEPVDAVITWVDGGDPAHRRKLDAYLASLGCPRPATADPTRFSDEGELAWCLASIVRFAPWFRRIWIVSDDQRPVLLDTLRGTPWETRVRLVDHRTLFAGLEDCLPTFNSRSISSLFWRIPGIAERHVYFNDDFVLLQPVQPGDFFRDDGVVVRGRWERQAHRRWSKRVARMLGSRRQSDASPTESRAQDLSARLAGFDRRCFRLEHCPYPMRRSTLADYFAANPALLRETVAHRLRHPAQLRPESLATHLEFAAGHAQADQGLKLVHLKPSRQPAWRVRAKLGRAGRDPRAAFACVQSLDEAEPAMRDALRGWLDARVGTLAAAAQAAPG
jgi:hypothetical protein